MKSKKEYILLFIVILAVSSYLIFRNPDKIHYKLPDIPKIAKNEITKIELSKSGSSISLFERDNVWLIGPEEYRADADSVNQMVDLICGLTVRELVAEAENDPRYDLTEEKKISIKAWAKDTLMFEFDIGKTAPSRHHTYIKLFDNPRVYLADGSFRDKFNKTVDDLRDKTVLAFEKDGIQKIEIIKGGQSTVFVKKELPTETPNTADKTEAPPEIPTKTTVVWENSEGKKADESALGQVLTTLSNLKCQSFLDGQQKGRFAPPLILWCKWVL